MVRLHLFYFCDKAFFRRFHRFWAYMFCRTCWFFAGLSVSATSAAPPATAHPSIKESTKGGGAKRRLLYGWVCGRPGWGFWAAQVSRGHGRPNKHFFSEFWTLIFKLSWKQKRRGAPVRSFCRRYRAEISAMRPKTNVFVFFKHMHLGDHILKTTSKS